VSGSGQEKGEGHPRGHARHVQTRKREEVLITPKHREKGGGEVLVGDGEGKLMGKSGGSWCCETDNGAGGHGLLGKGEKGSKKSETVGGTSTSLLGEKKAAPGLTGGG